MMKKMDRSARALTMAAVGAGLLCTASLIGCGGNTSATTSTAETSDDASDSEAAAEAVQSAGAATEGSASIASLRVDPGFASRALEWLEPSAQAATSICDKVIEQDCDGNVKSVQFAECKMTDLARAPEWNGGMTLTFDSDETCAAVNVEEKTAPTSGSMVRTFAEGTTLTFTNRRGKSVVEALDSSENLEAWDGTVVAGGGIKVTFEADEASQIDILGFRSTVTNTEGKEIRNRIITTSSPLVRQGIGPNRTIKSGAVKAYHNLAKEVVTSTIESELQFEAGCCFAKSGKLKTTFDGSSKYETLEFSETCGQATRVQYDESGAEVSSETIQLRRCL